MEVCNLSTRLFCNEKKKKKSSAVVAQTNKAQFYGANHSDQCILYEMQIGYVIRASVSIVYIRI